MGELANNKNHHSVFVNRCSEFKKNIEYRTLINDFRFMGEQKIIIQYSLIGVRSSKRIVYILLDKYLNYG